jgi:hypothetical protein
VVNLFSPNEENKSHRRGRGKAISRFGPRSEISNLKSSRLTCSRPAPLFIPAALKRVNSQWSRIQSRPTGNDYLPVTSACVGAERMGADSSVAFLLSLFSSSKKANRIEHWREENDGAGAGSEVSNLKFQTLPFRGPVAFGNCLPSGTRNGAEIVGMFSRFKFQI